MELLTTTNARLDIEPDDVRIYGKVVTVMRKL